MRRFLDRDKIGGYPGEPVFRILQTDALKHQLFIGVFMIHHKQPMLRGICCAGHGEIAEIIAVVAKLHFLRGRRLPQRIEGRRSLHDRIAPAHEDLNVIALGDAMLVIHPGGYLFEIEASASGSLCRSCGEKRERSHGRCYGRDAERALEHVAALESGGDYVTDGRIGTGISTSVFRRLVGLGTSAMSLCHGNLAN
jgi:hypothetical protein